MSRTGLDRESIVRPSRVHGLGLFADRDVGGGTTVAEITGRLSAVRSEFSMQIDHNLHVEADSSARYVNHSCEPNCALQLDPARSLQLVALGNIKGGEELTLDYASFEKERPKGPIPCHCRSAQCRGKLTGYLELSSVQQAELVQLVLPYLSRDEAARRGEPQ